MLDKFFNRKGGEASIPEGKRVYAIGDVHGRLDLMDALLDAIATDSRETANTQLVFLGDYVDRGEHSRGVIERLEQRQ